MRRLGSLRRLHELSAGDWALLAQACLLLPLVTLSLQSSGLQQTRERLLAFLPARNRALSSDHARARVRQVARAVARAASRGPVAGTCLSRALTVWTLLGRHGITSEVCIGVHTDPAFAAHAWVEHDGVCCTDGPEVVSRYTPLTRVGVNGPMGTG